MKITRIAQQVKRKDRYSVYIDEKYSFSLSDYQLVSSGLRVGREFSQQELDDFLAESSFGKAYERTLNYVMIRPRSEKEIKDYLTRTFLYPKPKIYKNRQGERVFKKVTVDKQKVSQMIERVVDRLHKKGYINDERFAKTWVESRRLIKKSSKRKLQQELMKKGIGSAVINDVLSDYDEAEAQNLLEVVSKKRRLTKYQDDVKLTQYLLRQGFNYEDIKQALKNE